MKKVYCATPSRFAKRKDEICKYVVEMNKGFLPFHPFFAFPFEYYEGHPNVGREESMKICFDAVRDCNEFWLFGISKGCLQELSVAKKEKKIIRYFMNEFDPEWKKYYEQLGCDFGDPLKELTQFIDNSVTYMT